MRGDTYLLVFRGVEELLHRRVEKSLSFLSGHHVRDGWDSTHSADSDAFLFTSGLITKDTRQQNRQQEVPTHSHSLQPETKCSESQESFATNFVQKSPTRDDYSFRCQSNFEALHNGWFTLLYSSGLGNGEI